MKKSSMMMAVFAIISTAAMVSAEGISVNFDGETAEKSGYSDLMEATKSRQNDNIGYILPAPVTSKPERAETKKELPGIRAVMLWPDGRKLEGMVSCFRAEESVSCAVKPDAKGLKEDFLLKGLVRNLMASSDNNRHSYHNWSGPQLFSCTDVCRDVQVLDRVEVEWTKECNGSVSISGTEPGVEAGCTVTKSEKKIYRNERECYTHECVCVKNCY